MKTLVFGFQGNLTEDLLGLLDLEDFYVIKRVKDRFQIDEFLEYIKLNNPEKIIGLGIYSGRDKDRIRLEEIAVNKFRNGTIGEFQSFHLDNFIEHPDLKHASHMGNSWCNLVSYKIMEMKTRHQISSLYDCLHIPPDMNLFTIVGIISSCLK